MRNYTYLGSNTGYYGLENALLRPKIIKMKFFVITRFKFKKIKIFEFCSKILRTITRYNAHLRIIKRNKSNLKN